MIKEKPRERSKINIIDDIKILESSKLEQPKIDSLSNKPNIIRQILCILGPLEILGDDGLLIENKRKCKAKVRSNDALIYEISIKALLENVPKELIREIAIRNQSRWKLRGENIQKSKKVLRQYENKKAQQLYQTKNNFKKEEDLLKHINKKKS